MFQRFPLTQITIKPSNQSQSDIRSASLCSVYNNKIKLSTSWVQYFLSDCLCFTNFIPWCPPLATYIWCCPPLLTCTETLPPSIFCKRMQQSLTCQFLEKRIKKDTFKFGEPLDYSILLGFRVHLDRSVCFLLALDRGPVGHKGMSFVFGLTKNALVYSCKYDRIGIFFSLF
jgi:hypothetical protein